MVPKREGFDLRHNTISSNCAASRPTAFSSVRARRASTRRGAPLGEHHASLYAADSTDRRWRQNNLYPRHCSSRCRAHYFRVCRGGHIRQLLSQPRHTLSLVVAAADAPGERLCPTPRFAQLFWRAFFAHSTIRLISNAFLKCKMRPARLRFETLKTHNSQREARR
jgi:hypothetical protein